jgi:hypothetical protein
MALVNCPECSRPVSDAAISCPHCGHPIEGPPPARRLHPVLAVVAVLAFLIPLLWLTRPSGPAKPRATPPVAERPAPETEAPVSDAKTELTWGPFSDHPARAAYTQAELVGAKELLLLFYGLRRAPFEPAEFAAFFPDWRPTDPAWALARNQAEKRGQLEAAHAALRDKPLLVRNREIRVGAYDARRGGFPLYRSPDPRENRLGLPRTVVMWDLSASGQADLRRINEAAAKRNRRYTNLTTAIELDNVGWRDLDVDFLPWPAADAARVAAEFGHGQPLDEPAAIRELGKGEQGYRTLTGYFVARPVKTEGKRVAMEGEVYLRKTVHMAVDQMILATPHGTVLGAFAAR